MEKRAKNNVTGALILLLAALIWGLAFVAQDIVAKKGMPPFFFNAIRCFIGSVFIGILYLVKSKITKTPVRPEKGKGKTVLLGGVMAGIFLFISINFQQVGMTSYPDGVAASARGGFLTAVYVVLVPLASIFLKKKVDKIVWLATLVAINGVYLLSMQGGFDGIYFGDVMMLFCALSFTFHILTIDHFGAMIDGVLLSCIQFAVASVLSFIVAFCAESMTFDVIVDCLPQLLFMGVCSSGIAYTLQIIGQRYAEPAIASLSMSFESVFGALGGWVILHNVLSVRELIGCALVFVAVVLAQMPTFFDKSNKIKKEV